MTYFTGDTIRVRSTFTDRVPEGDPAGPVVDPDSNTVTVTIYDSDFQKIKTDTASRENTGIYFYDWIMPSVSGIYYVEFKGLFSTYPELNRKKFTVKERPSS